MAYARAGFGALAGQGRAGDLPALYVYTTTDAHTAVDAAGYFNDLSDQLSVGDMIIVHGAEQLQCMLLYQTHQESLMSVMVQ
jgi:hypothetical protein